MSQIEVLNGNMSAAHAARLSRPDVIAAYPITPQTPVVEYLTQFHADGLLKDEEIYNIFDTNKILKKPVSIGITDRSGVAGITYWIQDNLKVKIEKNHAGVLKIKEWIDTQYEAERTIGISDEEMWTLVRKHLPELKK